MHTYIHQVHFWSSRTVDLSGIASQLELDGVKKIVEVLIVTKSSYLSLTPHPTPLIAYQVLNVAKSSYLKPFDKLSKLILEGTTEAVDNLK